MDLYQKWLSLTITITVRHSSWHIQVQNSTQIGIVIGFITLAPPSTTIFAPLT